jgi:nicotinamide-nucleotide adenylyltransferase
VVFSNDNFTHELYGKRGKSIISVDLKSRNDLSGTNIRNLILTDQTWKEFVPSGTIDVLSQIDGKKRLEDL